MREILAAILALKAKQERGALATVVSTKGSSPRKAGAKMLVTAGGATVGTIGGGCVDAAILHEAEEVMRSGQAKLVDCELTADAAAGIGMICGGSMSVFVEPVGFHTVE